MLHHGLAVLDADLHAVLLLSVLVLLQGLAIDPLILLLFVCVTVGTWVHHHDSILLVPHLTILKGKFINDDRFSLIRQSCALPVNVLVVAMTNDLATWQFYFTC